MSKQLDKLFNKKWNGFFTCDIKGLQELTSQDFAYEVDKMLALQGIAIKEIEVYEDNRRIIIDIYTKLDFAKMVYHMDNSLFYTNDNMYYSDMENALKRAKELGFND